MIERRTQPVRREFNELIRDPSGRVSEAKLWSNIFKGGLFYVLMTHTDKVLADASLMALVLASGIMPDLLKKWISAKAGAAK